MLATYGLTHLALAVRDPLMSFAFYRDLLGAEKQFEGADFVQFRTPGCHDAIVLRRSEALAGKAGGIEHFGFRVPDPAAVEEAIIRAESIGARIIDQGEFCPGEPYVYVEDPDGYMVEIWFE